MLSVRPGRVEPTDGLLAVRELGEGQSYAAERDHITDAPTAPRPTTTTGRVESELAARAPASTSVVRIADVPTRHITEPDPETVSTTFPRERRWVAVPAAPRSETTYAGARFAARSRALTATEPATRIPEVARARTKRQRRWVAVQATQPISEAAPVGHEMLEEVQRELCGEVIKCHVPTRSPSRVFPVRSCALRITRTKSNGRWRWAVEFPRLPNAKENGKDRRAQPFQTRVALETLVNRSAMSRIGIRVVRPSPVS